MCVYVCGLCVFMYVSYVYSCMWVVCLCIELCVFMYVSCVCLCMWVVCIPGCACSGWRTILGVSLHPSPCLIAAFLFPTAYTRLASPWSSLSFPLISPKVHAISSRFTWVRQAFYPPCLLSNILGCWFLQGWCSEFQDMRSLPGPSFLQAVSTAQRMLETLSFRRHLPVHCSKPPPCALWGFSGVRGSEAVKSTICCWVHVGNYPGGAMG